MSHPCVPNPVGMPQLDRGLFGVHIDAFVDQLIAQGYAYSTAQATRRLLADLNRWLQQHTLAASALDEPRIAAFLQDRYQRYRPGRSDRAVLQRLLEHLRAHGVIPALRVEPNGGTSDGIVEDFQHYLSHQRCLAPTTISSYLATVRRFLQARFGTQPLRLEALCVQDVTGFMVQQARQHSPGHVKLLATALRSFCRFLLQRGAIHNDLTHAVPTVPHWRLSTVPRFLPAADVDRLLQSCDRTTPHGQRDYAILLLLARLGLRASEVVTLTLEDLDWDAGDLCLRSKGARHDRLPLPHEVGAALAVYLCDGRPPSATRRVFVRMRAPRRGLASAPTISTIVRRALERAGLRPAHTGAHLLRHSLATQLLHNGASLAEIGELLRHQNIETTRIYAKVDQRALGALALPWPGGEV